jgi:hypothetical protein
MLPMEGGTTFTFVTDGSEVALAQARTAAGERLFDGVTDLALGWRRGVAGGVGPFQTGAVGPTRDDR